MTSQQEQAYNAKCTGKYRLYDTGTSWGVTLYNTETGEFKEVFINGFFGNEFWQHIDGLCGYHDDGDVDGDGV